MKKVVGVILFIFFMTLTGCKVKLKAPEGYSILAVQKNPAISELFFTGTVQPLRVFTVASPVEGVIEKKYFEYGQQVKNGETLFSIHSVELEKDYREALTSYLKSKEQYETNRIKFQEDEVLQQAGIISKNEYHSSQTSANDAYLGYLQAEQALQRTFEKAQAKIEDVKKIMMNDREAVTKALSIKFDILNLNATAEGVALLPEKGAGTGGESDSSNSGSTKFIVGSQVKAGQVLVAIGDMSGISLTVSVNQVDINAIKVGQKVTVTSDGFVGVVLQGEVTEVSSQAVSAGGSSSLPTFPVRVEIKNINEVDRQKIGVGMTAMVKIFVNHPPAIKIPIKAVIIKEGASTVKMFDRKTHKIIQVPIQTGQTSLQDVEVTQGLLSGDHILVHH